MTFIEFVGLVLSLAAMIFLIIKRLFEETQRRRTPEENARGENQREEKLRRVLKARGINLEERLAAQKAVKPPLQTLKQKQPLIPIDKSSSPSASFIKPAESYEVIRRKEISAGSRLISGFKSPREMFVIKEILDQPLSIRQRTDHDVNP